MFSVQCLSRAVRNENPGLLMAASTLLLPFQPLMVSALHTGMMEASIERTWQIVLSKTNHFNNQNTGLLDKSLFKEELLVKPNHSHMTGFFCKESIS